MIIITSSPNLNIKKKQLDFIIENHYQNYEYWNFVMIEMGLMALTNVNLTSSFIIQLLNKINN